MLTRYFSRFPHAIRGLCHAFVSDFGFRTQMYLGVLVISATLILVRPIAITELQFLALAWVLILITELQNSALEAALNRLHPELHDDIKHSKDMAAGAVLIAGLFLLFILGCIVWLRVM